MSPLADYGIRLRDGRPGEHRAPCPECARTKHRPRDDALAVKLDADGGAVWHCHRCGWHGSLRPLAERRTLGRRAAFPPLTKVIQPDDRAEHNRELARQTW